MATQYLVRRTARGYNATMAEADSAVLAGLVRATAGTVSLYEDSFTSAITLGGGTPASGAGHTLTLKSGAGATDSAGGAVSIISGAGNGTGNSGNVSMDVGAPGGSGTAGTVTIGGTNAESVTIGRSGKTTTIAGNLDVTGATTTVSSTNLAVNDDLIIVNADASTGDEAGIAFERGSTGDDALVLWNEVDDRFELGLFNTVGGTTAPTGTLTTFSDMKVNTLLLDGTAITADGALTITATSAALGLTGTSVAVNTTAGSPSWTFDASGNLLANTGGTLGANGATRPSAIFCSGAVTGGDGGTSEVLINDGVVTASAGLTVTATAADLNLTSTTASVVITGPEADPGAVQLTASNAAGGIDINAGGTSGTVTIDGGGACTITTAGINLAAGSSEIDLTTSGTIDLNATAGAVQIDAAVASNFTVVGAALTLSTTTSGTLTVNGAAVVDIDAGAALSLNSSGGTINVGNDAVATTITVGNSTGATQIDLNAGTGGVNVGTNAIAHEVTIGTVTGAGGVTIQTGTGGIDIGDNGVSATVKLGTGAAAMTVIVGSNNTTSTTTIDSGSGGMTLDADGAFAIDAEGNSTINAWDLTVTLDETQTADSGTAGNPFALTAGTGAAAGATNPGGTGGTITETGGVGGAADANNAGGVGGAITLTAGVGGAGSATQLGGAGGDITLSGGAAGASGGAGTGNAGRVRFISGTTPYYLTASGVGPALTTSAQTIIEAINEIDAAVSAVAADRLIQTFVTTGLTVGAPVYITSTTDTVGHGDADVEAQSNIIGLVETVGGAGVGKVVTHGLALAVFAAGDTWTNGDPVFLSTDTGRCCFTAPSGDQDTIIELGYLKDATGSGASSGLSATTVDGETAWIHLHIGARTLIDV